MKRHAKLQIELSELDFIALWEYIHNEHDNKVIHRIAHEMYITWQEMKENKKNIIEALENKLF